jgi:hypothetical protein
MPGRSALGLFPLAPQRDRAKISSLNSRLCSLSDRRLAIRAFTAKAWDMKLRPLLWGGLASQSQRPIHLSRAIAPPPLKTVRWGVVLVLAFGGRGEGGGFGSCFRARGSRKDPLKPARVEGGGISTIM